MTDTGMITVSEKGGSLLVLAYLDDQAPSLEGGVGGWGAVARLRRTALSEWQGTELFKYTISILLDERGSGNKVETLLRRLEAWGRPVHGGMPPLVNIEGPGLEHTDLDWVVNGLSRGDAILTKDGRKTRQAVTLELLEYVESAFLLPSSTKGVSKYKWVSSRKGDTLVSIAAWKLGSGKKWPVLKALNPKIRDPKQVLRINTSIKIPK